MDSIRSQYIVHFNPIVDMYVIVHTDIVEDYFQSNFNFGVENDMIAVCASLKEVNSWFDQIEKECMI